MTSDPSSSTPLLADSDADVNMTSSQSTPTPPPPPPAEDWSDMPKDVMESNPEEIKLKARMIDNDIKVRLHTVSVQTRREMC
jgi:hypothetical protein